jgi:hypothetical protein
MQAAFYNHAGVQFCSVGARDSSRLIFYSFRTVAVESS